LIFTIPIAVHIIGKNSHVFNPHSFTSDEEDVKDAWLPFGSGSWKCVGMKFSLTTPENKLRLKTPHKGLVRAFSERLQYVAPYGRLIDPLWASAMFIGAYIHLLRLNEGY
jgi:hypothetical protein